MGYRVLGNFEDVLKGYGPRKGLEGPFNFSGRVLYYDPKEGAYYDPRSDFYVAAEEMTQIRDGFLAKFG